MKNSALAYQRMKLKSKLLRESAGLCEWCGTVPADDLHEIVNRGRTTGEARRLSFVPELSCVLCRVCHDKAHTRSGQKAILSLKIQSCGYGTVLKALETLKPYCSGLKVYFEIMEELNEENLAKLG